MTLNKKKNKRGTINDSGFGKLISTIMVAEPTDVIKALQAEKNLVCFQTILKINANGFLTFVK